MSRTALTGWVSCVVLLGALLPAPAQPPTEVGNPGSLEALGADGKSRGVCPLEHTDVSVAITGFLARVTVRQQFHNPYEDKIEAIYTFPLPHDGAVDDMQMKVGDRTIRGEIRKREEARQIYEQAKQQGKVASLLDQERPNIFTQAVANIVPGENVTVTIRYTELIKYEDGQYEFVFPTVVGPRYMPGAPTSRVPEVSPEMKGKVVEVGGPTTGAKPKGTGWSPDTDQVPDASKISPLVIKPGMRAGHDLSVRVRLDAGRKLQKLESVLHEVDTEEQGPVTVVTLKDKAVIPNKDFLLRYSTATDEIGDSLFVHSSGLGKFFTLVVEPPKRTPLELVTPKELVFVLDTSGSMNGYPLNTAKATMQHCLDGLNPDDTFNLITFAGSTRILFDKPVPATAENVKKAQDFLAGRRGGGGTEMMKAIKAALDPSDAQDHVRIVCFMTDGYVGNDMAILGEIRNHPNARVFSFGIGKSVNRFLLDGMAREGRGEVQHVQFGEDAAKVAAKFYKQFRNPVLTDIELDWADLQVADTYPKQAPDLYSSKPVILRGRYLRPGKGQLTIRGQVAGKPFERSLDVELPEKHESHAVLGPLWARARIDDLMRQDWQGLQRGSPRPEIKETITNLGLEFRLMTQYTSFVAVEEKTVTEGGASKTMTVPVELPEGVSYEGVFGVKGDKGDPWARTVRRRMGGRLVMGLASPSSLTPGAAASPPKPMAAPAVPLPPSVRVAAARPAGAPGAAGKDGAPGRDGARGPAGPKGDPGPPGEVDYNRVKQIVADLTEEFKEELAELKGRTDNLQAEALRLRRLQERLDPALHGLANRVATQGTNRNLKLGDVEVEDGRVKIAVWITGDLDKALAKLKALGFAVTAEARERKLLVGAVPVAKLEALALLADVVRVAPARQAG